MRYINFKCPDTGTIETLEDCKGMTRSEKTFLLGEYKVNERGHGGYYWLSSRATKEYYTDKKSSNIYS